MKNHLMQISGSGTMKVSILFVAVCAAVLATGQSELFTTSTFLGKQQAVLDLFQHVNQKNLYNTHAYKLAEKFVFEADKYSDPSVFATFQNTYKYYDTKEPLSLINERQLPSVKALFSLFMAAKDLDTFFSVASWARYNVDSELFAYIFRVSLLQRKDTEDVVIPAPYETNPFFFFDAKTIEKAMEQQMQGYENVPKQGDAYVAVIQSNYSGDFKFYNYNDDLNYFTEDIGMNLAMNDLNVRYPFWNHVKLDAPYFIYYFQEIVARYYMERLANNMGKIPEFSWTEPFETGFSPNLRYYNGLAFASRDYRYKAYNRYNYEMIDKIVRLEGTLRSMRYQSYNLQDRIDITVEYFNLAKYIFGESGGGYGPGAMQHYETMFRDPISYQFVSRFLNFFPIEQPKPFVRDNINFPGVKILKAETDKLVTYFDHFEADITNAVDVNGYYDKLNAKSELVKFGRLSQYNGEDVVIKVRQQRLNHLAFNYRVTIQSDKAYAKAKLKVFIGPKYDQFGFIPTLNENRRYFFVLDTTYVELKEGENQIERSCHDFPRYHVDQTSYYELYKKVMLAAKGSDVFDEKVTYGFPYRMMLPKGNKDGYPVQLFFFLYEEEDKDNFKYTYPLNREINNSVWFTSNMFYYNTFVYHKTEKEVNSVYSISN